MILDNSQIGSLLSQRAITNRWPWSTNNEETIDNHWKSIVSEVCHSFQMKHKSEFGHYGSGYASFVDTWFYRETDEFRFDSGNCFIGLVALFSRLSDYYVVGQGQKTWHEKGGSSYLPDYEFVDRINQKPIVSIVDEVCSVLDKQNLKRLKKDELSPLIDPAFQVPTILSDPPYRYFDAIFYWED